MLDSVGNDVNNTSFCVYVEECVIFFLHSADDVVRAKR